MTRSFGLDAPSALQAFEAAVKRLKDDALNKDLARDCAIKAWHLGDHVFKALGSSAQFKDVSALQHHVRETCPSLAYLHEICIESKHAELSRNNPRTDTARYQAGGFSHLDFDPHDFDTDRLEIKLTGDQTVLFSDVVDRALSFWSTFFHDNGIK